MIIRNNISLRPMCTLNAGGVAQQFAVARTVDELSEIAIFGHESTIPVIVLGSGSNILPSDEGVPGLVVWNRANKILVFSNGEVIAETGCTLQDLFLRTVQRGLTGFEYAVGIPGSLGGALVSNAGAYRSNVSEFIQELEVVRDGRREWVSPSVLEFAYRDSILRRSPPPRVVVLQVRFVLSAKDSKEIYDEARDYQRQRISKQPPQASAGSFFKNVEDRDLSRSLPNLPHRLKSAGVVPAGFLIENVGLMGTRHHGAMFSRKHANFIVNCGGANAADIRSLAEHAKKLVYEKFGIQLEEEVLYLGDWTKFVPSTVV